jgi:hypothetical protein
VIVCCEPFLRLVPLPKPSVPEILRAPRVEALETSTAADAPRSPRTGLSMALRCGVTEIYTIVWSEVSCVVIAQSRDINQWEKVNAMAFRDDAQRTAWRPSKFSLAAKMQNRLGGLAGNGDAPLFRTGTHHCPSTDLMCLAPCSSQTVRAPGSEQAELGTAQGGEQLLPAGPGCPGTCKPNCLVLSRLGATLLPRRILHAHDICHEKSVSFPEQL